MNIMISLAIHTVSKEKVVRTCQKLLSRQLSEKYPQASIIVTTSHRLEHDEIEVKNSKSSWENTLLEREIAINYLQQARDLSESIHQKGQTRVA